MKNAVVLLFSTRAEERKGLREALAHGEYRRREAESAGALDTTLRNGCDGVSAVLVDASDPEGDGYQALELLHEAPAWQQVPVVSIISPDDETARARALALGVVSCLTDPCDPELLSCALGNVIRMREGRAAAGEAQRDRLTGLYNREAFAVEAARMISGRAPSHYVISYLNINRFTALNERYGEQIGDRVLEHVARSFGGYVESMGGIGCRHSSDRFVLLYPKAYMDSRTLELCRKMAENPPDIQRSIRISIGRCIVDDVSLSISSLINRAIMAEESIRSRYDVRIADFEESMRSDLLWEQRIVSEMSDALREGQFETWLQPQYDHATGLPIGAEALVRWRCPDDGQLISPGKFVPIFERNGFIYELDKYVWEQACALLRRLLDKGLEPVPISINLSRKDILKPDFPQTLMTLMNRHAISPDLLRLEITESAFSQSPDQLIARITDLVARGFTVEIDDFGSGYSSLNMLRDVPAQVVKLDMRFLADDGYSQRGNDILESVVTMARWLGMTVIAEGVETTEQADYLKSIDCPYVQGHLYGEPMRMEEYEALASNSPAHPSHRRPALEEAPGDVHASVAQKADGEEMGVPLNVVPGGILKFSADRELECAYVSGTLIKRLGYTDKQFREAFHNHFREMVLGNDWDRVERGMLGGSDTDTGRPADFRVQSADGRLHWFRGEAVRSLDRKDRPWYYANIVDITDLRDTGERLKRLSDGFSGGLGIFEHELGEVRALYINEGFFRFLGYRRDEYRSLFGEDYLATVLDEDRPTVPASLLPLFDKGEDGTTCTLRCRTKSGGVLWLSMSAHVSERHGDVTDFNVILYDITPLKDTEQRLRLREEEYRLAAAQADVSIARYYIADRSVRFPPADARRLGYPETMNDIPYGRVRSGSVSPDTSAAYIAFYERIIRGEKEGSVWYQSRLNGRWEWLESHFSTFFSNDGKPVSAVLSLRKITEEVEHEAIYKKWAQSLDERPASSYTLLRCSLRRNASFDLGEGSLLARSFPVPDTVAWDERIHKYADDFVSPVDHDEFLAALSPNGLLSSYRNGRRTIVVEYREVKPGGTERWMRLTVEMVAYPSSRCIAAYLLFEDIDEQKRASLQTQAQAATDPLTGLLNRCAFEQAVKDHGKACSEHALCALLMIDLDQFKQINDTFGHMAGDKALVEVAQKLKGSLRRDDLICRFGGDEFMVFICGLASRDEIGKKAGQLCTLLQRPLNDKNRLSVSIGIAVGPDDGRNFDSLYRKADRALYHVKGGGRNAYVFYDEGMENSDQPRHAERE